MAGAHPTSDAVVMNWSATFPSFIPDHLVEMMWVFIVLGAALTLTLIGAALVTLKTFDVNADRNDRRSAERRSSAC